MSDARILEGAHWAQAGYRLRALVPNTSSSEPGEIVDVEFYNALGAGWRTDGEAGWELIPWHRIALLTSAPEEATP